MSNDLPIGIQLQDITFLDVNYSVDGNSIGLSGGILNQPAFHNDSNTNVINIDLTLTGTQTFNNSDPIANIVYFRILSTVDLQSYTLTLTPGVKMSGPIVGSGGISVLGGNGEAILAGASTYFGPTNVTGELQQSGAAPNSPVTLPLNSSRLSGIGVAGQTTSSGILTPGIARGGGVGVLSTGSVTMNPGSLLEIQLDGCVPGETYDVLDVSGSVNINSANLSLILGTTPFLNQQFVILDNDASDAVIGAFAGKPEGATFNVGPYPFEITYMGETGNDVVLTSLSGATPVCGNGIVEGCEQCDDGNTLNGDCCSSTCQYEASSVVCRASSGDCDPAENCTGSSGICPADAKSTAQCRASAGTCDVAEFCDGLSNNCPADAKSTAQCRASAGTCDVAEFCDGLSNNCPVDAKSTAVCRASVAGCDIAESCDGIGNNCPADAFQPSGTACRPSAGLCDVAENCTGSSAACPADAFQPSSTVCRPSAGPCDVAENCTGSSAACPADAFQPSSAVCRPSAGLCDIAENCTGSSAACPADSFASTGAPCRAAANDCDVAEACTGSSSSCPTDNKQPDGTGCDDGNTCTQNDTCEGGVCIDGGLVDCDDGDACTADSCDPTGGCINDDAPATGCLSSGKSILLIKNSSDDNKDKLLWKWIKGDALTQMDLADPTVSDGYAVCVYAGITNTLIADAALPPGPSWSAIGSKGYKFKGASPNGLSLALLSGGSVRKSKALAKGRGPALPDPTLPLAYPITVQLKKDASPLCLQSTFTVLNEKKNDATQFKAKK